MTRTNIDKAIFFSMKWRPWLFKRKTLDIVCSIATEGAGKNQIDRFWYNFFCFFTLFRPKGIDHKIERDDNSLSDKNSLIFHKILDLSFITFSAENNFSAFMFLK